MDSLKKQSWVQLDNGYLSKTPIWQYVLVSLIFPMWGMAASLNDILITQFKDDVGVRRCFPSPDKGVGLG